jgi:uncharacterized protein YggE
MKRFVPVLLGLTVSAYSPATSAVSAQGVPAAPPRTLDVSADASVMRPPDRATVRLGVETLATTAREATASNAEAMAAMIDALEASGIPSSAVRTRSIALSPRYERAPSGEQPVIVGYQAENQVSVRVDEVDQLGRVVDTAIEAGANRVLGIQFEISDPEAAYHEALELAVAKARREAEVLARAMGETLGPVLRIATGGTPALAPGRSEMMLRVSTETPVHPGELEVRAVVHITYRLGS